MRFKKENQKSRAIKDYLKIKPNQMKKLLLLLLFLPTFVFSDSLSIDLVCDGESTIFCEDSKKCGSEPAVEIIKIAGNTLVHKIHGMQFLDVDANNISTKELDDDGSIGFSFNVSRKTGKIEIIRGWDKPYHFRGVCELVNIKHPYDPS